jgi:hypothetical protein
MLLLLAMPAVAVRAAPTPAQAVHALAGTYQCVDRESTGRTWRFVTVNKPYESWLQLNATYPAQNGAPRGTAITFLGFDADAKRWNIIAVSGTGSYYTRYSTSPALDGSKWTDGFPADGGRATIRTFGSGRYTFELTTPAKTGPATSSDVVCTRE